MWKTYLEKEFTENFEDSCIFLTRFLGEFSHNSCMQRCTEGITPPPPPPIVLPSGPLFGPVERGGCPTVQGPACTSKGVVCLNPRSQATPVFLFHLRELWLIVITIYRGHTLLRKKKFTDQKYISFQKCSNLHKRQDAQWAESNENSIFRFLFFDYSRFCTQSLSRIDQFWVQKRPYPKNINIKI